MKCTKVFPKRNALSAVKSSRAWKDPFSAKNVEKICCSVAVKLKVKAKKNAKFVKITKAGFYESMVHSVEMTNDVINYKL